MNFILMYFLKKNFLLVKYILFAMTLKFEKVLQLAKMAIFLNYRIHSYTAPLLNTTSAFSKVLFLGKKSPCWGIFLIEPRSKTNIEK